MLAVQLSPPLPQLASQSLSLSSASLHHSMSTSPPVQPNSLSVFNALGSYADRMKSPPNGSASLTPNGTTSHIPASSSVAPSPKADPAKQSRPKTDVVEDGPWETVQTGRQRPREERKSTGGSTSRNWRDRPAKDASDEGERRVDSKSGGKKAANSSVPPESGAGAITEKPTNRVAMTPASGTKSAWGVTTPVAQQQQTHITPSSDASTSIQTPRSGPQRSQTVPSSPSLNGTIASHTSASVPASLSSPNLSVETASTSTAPTSIALRGNDVDEDTSWRMRQNEKADEVDASPQKQSAPAPAVNAWDARKKTLAPAANVNGTMHAVPMLQFGTATSALDTTHAAMPNGNGHHGEAVKIARQKKPVSAVTPMHDANAWPDVAQAAGKAAEEKGKSKEKSKSEGSSVTEETVVSGSSESDCSISS